MANTAVAVDDRIIIPNGKLANTIRATGAIPFTESQKGLVIDWRYRPTVDVLKAKGIIDAVVTLQNGYKPSGDYEIRAHQSIMIDFFLAYTAGYNYADLGTGKTAATLWAFDILKNAGRIDVLIVLTPMSTIEPAWYDDATLHVIPHRKVSAVLGSKKTRTKLLLNESDVYITNHDAAKSLEPVLVELSRRKRIMLVVDEAVAIARYDTARSKAIQVLGSLAKRKYVLTGTPIAQSLMNAHGLMRFINNNPKAKQSLTDFKETYFYRLTQYVLEPKATAVNDVTKLMSPALYMRTRDVVTLPENIRMFRYPPLTEEQQRAYDNMLDEYVMEHKSGVVIEALNAAARLGKLFQICCGLVKHEDGVVEIEPKHKMDDLYDIITESASKVIVVAPYVAVITYITDKLNAKYGEGYADYINGTVTGTKRGDIVRKFQDADSELRALVVHPKSAGHGLTLTEADTLVFFTPHLSVESSIQVLKRHDRPSQRRVTRTIFLVSTPVEKKYFKSISDGEVRNDQFVSVYNALMNESIK